MDKYLLLNDRWEEIRFDIRVNWQRLSIDEIADTKGNPDALIGLLQKKYGYSAHSARNMLNEFLLRFSQTPDHSHPRSTILPSPERLMH